MKKIISVFFLAFLLASCNSTQSAKTTEECRALKPNPYQGYTYTFDANAEPTENLFVISAGPVYSESNGGCVYQITKKSTASTAKEGDKEYSLYKMMTEADRYISSSSHPFDSIFKN